MPSIQTFACVQWVWVKLRVDTKINSAYVVRQVLNFHWLSILHALLMQSKNPFRDQCMSIFEGFSSTSYLQCLTNSLEFYELQIHLVKIWIIKISSSNFKTWTSKNSTWIIKIWPFWIHVDPLERMASSFFTLWMVRYAAKFVWICGQSFPSQKKKCFFLSSGRPHEILASNLLTGAWKTQGMDGNGGCWDYH